MKKIICLKIAEIDMRGQFCIEKNDSGHKKLIFLKVKPVFPGEISEFDDFFPFKKGKLCDVISPQLEELSPSNFV